MHFTYILKSAKSGKFYVGMSADPERRLSEHNAGKVTSTKPGIPWEKVYQEEFETLAQARKREKYFKTAAGRRFRKKLDL